MWLVSLRLIMSDKEVVTGEKDIGQELLSFYRRKERVLGRDKLPNTWNMRAKGKCVQREREREKDNGTWWVRVTAVLFVATEVESERVIKKRILEWYCPRLRFHLPIESLCVGYDPKNMFKSNIPTFELNSNWMLLKESSLSEKKISNNILFRKTMLVSIKWPTRKQKKLFKSEHECWEKSPLWKSLAQCPSDTIHSIASVEIIQAFNNWIFLVIPEINDHCQILSIFHSTYFKIPLVCHDANRGTSIFSYSTFSKILSML